MRIVISLLVVGSTISSLLLFSFHYKSSFSEQLNGRTKENFQDTPLKIIKIHHQNVLHKRNKTNTASISRSVNSVEINATNITIGASNNKERNMECFSQLNSQSWLENKRLGNQNSNDSRIIDDDYVVSSILKIKSLFSDVEINSQKILRHTLCAKSSRFLNLKFSSLVRNSSDGDDNLVGISALTKNQVMQQLSLRLVYLSVHVHQHQHALKEAKYRLENSGKCEPERISRNIGKYDFECPDAKFLVVPLKHSGLGGQMRLISAPALMAGIASERVVLFVNNSPIGPNFLQEPWDLSSCPRRDKQCFFLPDSPCVITHNEIQNATVLDKGERRAFFKTGQLPDHIEEERVVVMNMKDRPQRTPLNFRRKIAEIAREFFIYPLARKKPDDPRLPFLFAAADHILQEDEDIGNSFSYYGRNFHIHHGMVFFAMRPKDEFAERIDHFIDSTFGVNHKTDLAIGLPIRASDKCIDESECPSFETYMLLMQNVWDTNEKKLSGALNREIHDSTNAANSSSYANIILTSESLDVLEAKKAFHQENSTSRQNLSFPFRFITNSFDVLQNTGNPSKMSSEENNMEDIILSTLTSLKMQFYAKYSVGNCCSNHHLLLFDFLAAGCGAGATDHVANCMQDHEEEKFRICCGWTKTDECLSRRMEKKTRYKL